MLLNEFLKEHQRVQEQEATIEQLKKGMDVLTARVEEQASQLQKVSAQLEVSKSAPRTVEIISRAIAAVGAILPNRPGD